MLEDYRSYLTNVRNNLIQCGVEFPINPLSTYSELFYLGLQLDEVLWYYHILAVSGSEEALVGCMFSLRGYYKEKMRQVFYNEFRDFLQDYKKISTTYNLLQGYKGTDEELSSDEEMDLFEDITTVESNEDYKEVLLDSQEHEEVKAHGEVLSPNSFLSMVGSSKEVTEQFIEEDFVPTEEYTSHGVFLDDVLEVAEPEVVSKDIEPSKEYVPHGIYLDELSEEDNNLDENGFEEAEEEVFEDSEDGVFEDSEEFFETEEEEDTEGIEYDEDGFEIDSEESVFEEEDEEYDEDGFEIEDVEVDENGFEVDENGFEVDDEEDSFETEEGVEYDENGFEVDDSESIQYDEDGFEIEDESDSIQYDEDGFELEEEDDGIQYDENGFEVDDSETDENGFEISDDDFEGFEEEDEPVIPEPSISESITPEPQAHPTQPRVTQPREKDITDYIQDAVNTTLTKGKRFIYKEMKKMKDLNND